MYKIATVLLLCFAIYDPVMAQANDEVWERLFKFQHTMAEQGDSEAMLILGDMYRKGEGTDVDPNIALYWYNQAARAGNKKADERIELLLKQKDLATQTKKPAQEPLKNQKSTQEAGKERERREVKKSQAAAVKSRQEDKRAAELEMARKKSQQLAEQLAREREAAEKARSEVDRLKNLEQQLAQERAVAEKARRDMEAMKNRQMQLIQERKAAEQARIEAEKARLVQEQTAQNTEASTPVPAHKQASPANEQSTAENAKVNVNTFKSNPCDNPQVHNSYSCQLLNRRH